MAIVPMKRVIVATLAREGEALLRRLQELGVLHPEHLRDERESERINKIEGALHVQRAVLRDLDQKWKTKAPPPGPDEASPSYVEIHGWIGQERRLSEQLARLDRQITQQSPWGSFDPNDIRTLSENGMQVQLWQMERKPFAAWRAPEGAVVQVVVRGKRMSFCTIVQGKALAIDRAESVALPDQPLCELIAERDELRGQQTEMAQLLKGAARFLPTLTAENDRFHQEHHFTVVLERAFGNEWLRAFAGWVPEPEVESVKEGLRTFPTPVIVEARDPLPEETPPVKTRNTWFVRTFEPLLHLLGQPRYRGLDPALFFAPFMMLFFGICLGDAGYGLLMLLASWVLRRFLRGRVPGIIPVANMTLLFGIATIIWGILTGGVFGYAFHDRSWILLDVSSSSGDPMLLFKIAVGLGILHLTVAFFMAFAGAATWGQRIAKLGMVAVLWGGVLAVLKMPHWYLLLGAGLGAILFFSAEAKNPFARVGLGLWNIYGLTGLLGDVMSYARLFGLGLASGAIASVVNMLAGQVRDAVPVVGIVLAILVLAGGHAFNFAIGIIGALVHPARLHAVEALPKCVELTGAPYRPLVKR